MQAVDAFVWARRPRAYPTAHYPGALYRRLAGFGTGGVAAESSIKSAIYTRLLGYEVSAFLVTFTLYSIGTFCGILSDTTATPRNPTIALS